MRRQVKLSKYEFNDSNAREYKLSDLKRYDFSNDWGWEREEHYEITDIYEKTFFDAATHLLSDLRANLSKREKEYAT